MTIHHWWLGQLDLSDVGDSLLYILLDRAEFEYTVCPKQHAQIAHFVVLLFTHSSILPISFNISSLTLGNHVIARPNTSKAILKSGAK